MEFILADTFTAALAKLPAQDQKAVKISVLDLQLDPTAPGLQMHRIDKAKDPNFWSARVSRDIRLILHKTASTLLVAYVDHHDDAYAWAMRRRIETHPKTGAVQIVQVRERIEEAEPELAKLWLSPPPPVTPATTPLFAKLDENELLSVGVPQDWIYPIQTATEDSFFELAERLPSEASEALLEFAATGILAKPVVEAQTDYATAFLHPDARRRFLTVENIEELAAALDAPWEKCSVFLHPSQRAVVERNYNGPSRVSGSAGTGKTVVALHRAVRLIRSEPQSVVLLATFSDPLANSLKAKLKILAGPDTSVVPRINVTSFQELGSELFQLVYARKPRMAIDQQVGDLLVEIAKEKNVSGFSRRFLLSEWTNVIDAWRVVDPDGYRDVPRLGRKNRLGSRQRDALWPVFAALRERLKSAALLTWAEVFHLLYDHYSRKSEKPYSYVVVDEAQDLGVPEMRLLSVIVPSTGQNRLFFAGDLGQRIFQQPFSWKALDIDVRGRSSTLKVNYRTSQQIRSMADTLLPDHVRDVDGLEESRKGTISVFEGPVPAVKILPTEREEIDAVADFIGAALAEGIAPNEIGVFVRSRAELGRARQAVERAEGQAVELTERVVDAPDRIAIGVMHLAKGLEFKIVSIMACDEDVLPLAERIDSVVDESDLDDVIETERHLLYVACTRARDRLLVTGVRPGSDFLADILASSQFE
jgi:superfamily I DNA/RNA helicase